MTPSNALGLPSNSNPAVKQSETVQRIYQTVGLQDKKKSLFHILCGPCLLREWWWHRVGNHRWWGWWLLVLWRRRRLRVEREWRVVHAILSRSLHAAELGRALEALVPKATLVWGSKVTLSVAVVIVAIVTTRVTAVSYVVATILSLTATKGSFGPTTKPSVIVPVTTTTKVTPATSIPIPTVILVATSSPPSTACKTGRRKKK